MGVNKAPHGGVLRNLYLRPDEIADAKARARGLPSWDMSLRQLCDLELLLNGAFSPLTGFLDAEDYACVLTTMRLASGVLWPMPITLDVTETFAEPLSIGTEIALRDPEGILIAVLEISSMFSPDATAEAEAVLGTDAIAHPGVEYLLKHTHRVRLGGRVRGIEPPPHYDFLHLRDSPQELRQRFEKLGWRRVVAFQTRSPMHSVHCELTARAARAVEANLLIHPVVGRSYAGDLDYFTRVRCYEKVIRQLPEPTTMLSLLPLAMRLAGPREALWHALIHKNYGCTHFIVGSDHASPRHDDAQPFYGRYDAQALLDSHARELDITIVPFKKLVYVEDRASFLEEEVVRPGMRMLELSDAEFSRRLREDLEIDDWFSSPEVIAELRRAKPPRHQQGFTVFLTGLSGAGKSTIAHALVIKLMELADRRVTLLDGDIVRKHLSSELGFSKEHRDLNVMRIGFVASEITKHGGIAICAPIAPYLSARRAIREMIESVGGFLEVHVATPIEVCEARDRKGLYAQARAGQIHGFTGVDDPYEVPETPELRVDTTDLSADLAAHRILIKLESMGLIR